MTQSFYLHESITTYLCELAQGRLINEFKLRVDKKGGHRSGVYVDVNRVFTFFGPTRTGPTPSDSDRSRPPSHFTSHRLG